MKPEVFNPYRAFRLFMIVPEVIAKCRELSAGAKLAYARLARYKGETGVCRPSMKQLAGELGISKDQARRYVHELIAAGFIRAEARYSSCGDLDANEYIFLKHGMFREEGVLADVQVPTSKDASTVLADMQGGYLQICKGIKEESHLRESSKRKNHTSPSNPDGGVEEARPDSLREQQAEWFGQFWEAYPRKVGKKAAEAAFRKKVTCEARWRLIWDGLQKQVAAMLAREPQYRPHAATWLNGERWNDEAEPSRVLAIVHGRAYLDRDTAREQKRDEMFNRLIASRLQQ